MSTLAERIDHAADPGYWAVEIRLADGTGPGNRYLCHADSNRKAFGMAVHLAGNARNLRGFSYFWIDEDSLEASEPQLPAMGAYGRVSDPKTWDRLMHAHQDAEMALTARQADASA